MGDEDQLSRASEVFKEAERKEFACTPGREWGRPPGKSLIGPFRKCVSVSDAMRMTWSPIPKFESGSMS